MRAILPAIPLLLLAACSDDPAAPEPTLLGEWEVVGVELNPINKSVLDGFANTVRFGHSYVRIDERLLWVVNKRGLGFRGEFVSEYAAGNTLDLGGESYRLTLDSHSLELEGPMGKLRLERREAIPDVEDWISDYESIHVQNTAFQSRGDLAWDGEDLWIAGGPNTKELIRIDSETGTAFPMALDGVNPSTIEFHDGACYVNDGSGSRVLELNVATAKATDIGMEVGGSIATLLGDGSVLWCGSAGTQKLHVFSPDPPTQLSSIAYGPGVLLQGGTAHDGVLYLVANNRITLFRYAIQGGTLRQPEAIGGIQLPGHKILGAAHDGETLWVNAEDQEFDAMRLHRIVPATSTP